jgi:hypothetical protein
MRDRSLFIEKSRNKRYIIIYSYCIELKAMVIDIF